MWKEAGPYIVGTIVAFVAWVLVYEAAKPHIADSMGEYVKRHALEYVPNDVRPLVQVIGGQTYANLLGEAVKNAVRENL